ncbi:M1 family metallopeptidase [Daejeonella sp. H1SJ63]|uniref:M1 family metallopeptidase n=1 Tax=Daejeonella sp. H1SJ63 TaxID=3034145 RepID=UPI0023EAA70D|nr:M1 family metallopeptidase [Daejeonella sp. H1SJ63]
MLRKHSLLTGLLLLIHTALFSQNSIFSRADTLRGTLSNERRSYDINYYHLDISIDIDNKFIHGSNLFRFKAIADIKKLQFDLFENLKIDKIIYRDKEIPYKREFNAVFIDFPDPVQKGSTDEFRVFYSGKPVIALTPPWDGGFTFSKDSQGKPWVSVACQGLGASSWWPNKDHQSDEVDSMLISITVPKGLMNVSNGRLRSVTDTNRNQTRFDWFVSYPINNYNVSLNIADYVHFEDFYQGERGKLSLNYFVLRENLEKAKKQFSANVKPMLKVFENWFGPYPFYRDGYKLIETPYLGMEHQTAIAYGNKYLNGYSGRDLSETGHGLKWDYIIVHESGHEWFGNNISSKDIADMWIHEGFTMYSEVLYVESRDGKAAGTEYIRGIRKSIRNDKAIIGPYGVNTEGSGDMYYKGANLIHMIRTLIDNDNKWREILRGLNSSFGLQTTSTEEILAFINRTTGKDFSKIFDQYLRFADLPVLEYKTEGNQTSYRWSANVSGFDMPIRIKNSKQYQWIYPETRWKKLKSATFIPDTDNFYFRTNMIQ